MYPFLFTLNITFPSIYNITRKIQSLRMDKKSADLQPNFATMKWLVCQTTSRCNYDFNGLMTIIYN